MSFIGNFDAGSIVRGGFNSRDSNSAPANFTTSGVLRVYRNATIPGTTSGVTWANGTGAAGGVTPFDGVDGYHVYTIDSSANTGFFVAGDYRVILSSGTVDNKNVTGTQVGSFSLANRSCESNVVRWGGVSTNSAAVRSNVVQISGVSVSPVPVLTSGDALLTITSGILPNVITSGTIAPSALNNKGNWLQPTVAGRTLDVTSAGNAGIDWGNVENQGSTCTLSSSTIRLTPDALSSSDFVVDYGPVVASTSNTVTFMCQRNLSAYCANFVGAVVSVTFDDTNGEYGQPRIITSAVDLGGGPVRLTVSRAWDNPPTDSGPSIVTIWPFGVANAVMFSGSADTDVTALMNTLDAVEGRLPAALVNGRIDASVGAVASNAITAASIATDAVEKIADGTLTRNISNVESTAPEHSLTTIILANLENSITGTTLTIKRTDGTTTHVTKTLTTSPTGDKIVGIQ